MDTGRYKLTPYEMIEVIGVDTDILGNVSAGELVEVFQTSSDKLREPSSAAGSAPCAIFRWAIDRAIALIGIAWRSRLTYV